VRENRARKGQENLYALLCQLAAFAGTEGEAMRFVEIYLWCILYLSTYLLVSLVINLLTGWGDLIGITLIGLFLTLVLAIIMLWQDEREEREFEEMEPAEIVTPEALFFENQELLEVNTNAEKETTRTDPTAPATRGSGPEIRTDVRLSELSAPDDDSAS